MSSFKARNNLIKAFADQNGIKIYDWGVISKDGNLCFYQQFDLGVVVSFGHLIPEEIINSFKKYYFRHPNFATNFN